jgi:hypothetical protein
MKGEEKSLATPIGPTILLSMINMVHGWLFNIAVCSPRKYKGKVISWKPTHNNLCVILITNIKIFFNFKI